MPAEAYEAQWGGAFANNSGYLIRDMEGYKEADPIMYQVLKRQGINQLVVSPFTLKATRSAFSALTTLQLSSWTFASP